MKTVSQILNEAADLLEQPGAWTQGKDARNELGAGTYSADLRACSFCILGAIRRVGGTGHDRWKAVGALCRSLGIENIAEWNDAPERTQEEVVAALRASAAKAEGAAS
jgi:hypothetical protein